MSERELLIKNVKLIDLQSNGSMKKVSILIKQENISKIFSENEDITNLNYQIKDLSDHYVIPGLIDAHMHFFQSSGVFTRPDVLDLRSVKSYEEETNDVKNRIKNVFKRYLASGVIGIIDCGGPFWNFDVRTESQLKSTISPEVEVSGPLISTASREILDLGDPPIIKVDTPEDARALVRKCVENKPVFVKKWFIYFPETFEQDSLIIKAAIEETKKLGYRSAVHATELETAKRAIKYGADILVHSVFDVKIDQEFIDLVIKNEVIYIPTIIVGSRYIRTFMDNLDTNNFEEKWGDPDYFQSLRKLYMMHPKDREQAFETIRERLEQDPTEMIKIAKLNLKKLYDAGATIATGTDAGNIGTLHGASIHKEMEVMQDAGMKPIDILRSSTINAAKLFGDHVSGEIKEGSLADFIILEKNPLETISNTQSIKFIYKSGVEYTPEELIRPFDPEAIVQAHVNGYSNRDIEEFLRYYKPNTKIYDLKTGELSMEGLEQMRQRYSQLFSVSPNLKTTILQRTVHNNWVIDHELVTGFRGDNTTTVVAIYEVFNQLINRVWFAS